jgi:hypothetical protein
MVFPGAFEIKRGFGEEFSMGNVLGKRSFSLNRKIHKNFVNQVTCFSSEKEKPAS